MWSLRELWNGNSRPRKYLNFFPLSLPSSLPSSLLRCISFPHHPSIVLWIRLPLQKKIVSRRVLEKWKWYTDCAVGNTLKTYDIPWIKTIPISPPTCAIDHHCEVHGSSMPSEGADLFKHVRLLVVSSAENLHLVKSSTQPGWGLSFPRKSFKTKKHTSDPLWAHHFLEVKEKNWNDWNHSSATLCWVVASHLQSIRICPWRKNCDGRTWFGPSLRWSCPCRASLP